MKILKYCAQPSIKHYFKDGDGFYQQDNTPCHTANVVKKWMTENKMDLLSWPGNSPDMNPIEHVWDYIGNRIQECMFRNMDELFERVNFEWNKIPMNYITNLFESMDRLVSALITARGGSTKY